MKIPSVSIRFDDNVRTCEPGQALSGEYRLRSVSADEIKAIEWSVLWYTEGKGDEDLAVHEFQRLNVDDGDTIEPSRPQHFDTVLPASPLSYEGRIVKLRWCVRIRAFLRSGKEVVGQKIFQLGDVPAAKAEVP